jgi:hypothetical protein
LLPSARVWVRTGDAALAVAAGAVVGTAGFGAGELPAPAGLPDGLAGLEGMVEPAAVDAVAPLADAFELESDGPQAVVRTTTAEPRTAAAKA